MEKTLNTPPPRKTFVDIDISVVHKMRRLYSYVYQIGNKLPKRDKLSIHSYIEKKFLETFSILVSASLEPKMEKIITLKRARIKIETLKQLIRIEYETKIISEKIYLKVEENLQEISKMTNGWLKYTETQIPDYRSGIK